MDATRTRNRTLCFRMAVRNAGHSAIEAAGSPAVAEKVYVVPSWDQPSQPNLTELNSSKLTYVYTPIVLLLLSHACLHVSVYSNKSVLFTSLLWLPLSTLDKLQIQNKREFFVAALCCCTSRVIAVMELQFVLYCFDCSHKVHKVPIATEKCWLELNWAALSWVEPSCGIDYGGTNN